MKKRLLLTTLMILSISCLAACSHEHKFGDATCTEASKCSECDETEGEALGHTWEEATCDKAKTCKVCGTTEGEALGHTWKEATCDKAKTCKTCNASEGNALGHTVDVGVCTRCKAFINKNLFDTIVRHQGWVDDAINNAHSALKLDREWSSVSDGYYNILSSEGYINHANVYLEEIYDECISYTELKDIAMAAKTTLDSTPSEINECSVDAIGKWLNEYTSYLENYTSLLKVLENYTRNASSQLRN